MTQEVLSQLQPRLDEKLVSEKQTIAAIGYDDGLTRTYMIAKFQKTTLGTLALTGSLLALAACSPSKGTSVSTSTSEASRLQVQSQSLSVTDANGSTVSTQTVAVAPTLVLTGAVTPPSVNGQVLQANATTYTGTNVYIAYNLAGAAAGGGIDQISIATPAVPVLQSSLQFATLDVNNVFYANGALIVSGNSSTYDFPARIQRYSTTVLGAISTIVSDSPLVGYAADATRGNSLLSNTIYSVSGDNGGLTVSDVTALPGTLATPAPLTVAIQDARDVSTTNLVAGVLSSFRAYVVTGNALVTNATETAGQGSIRAYDSAGNYINSVNIGNTGASQAKSTIQAGLTYGIASAGSGGVRVFCLADLSITATAAPIAAGGVVNGAAYLAGYVFTAEGDQGVGVYALNGGLANSTACVGASLQRLGTINFGTSVSANNVTAVGSLLMVSGGIGGFKLVTVTPNALVTGLVTTL